MTAAQLFGEEQLRRHLFGPVLLKTLPLTAPVLSLTSCDAPGFDVLPGTACGQHDGMGEAMLRLAGTWQPVAPAPSIAGCGSPAAWENLAANKVLMVTEL